MKREIDPGESGGNAMPEQMNAIGLAYLKADPKTRQKFIEQVQQLMDKPLMRAVVQTVFISKQAYAPQGSLPLSVVKAGYDVLGVATPGSGQVSRTNVLLAGMGGQVIKYLRN